MIDQMLHEAMELLLAGDMAVLAALRAQYEAAKVTSVETNSAGGYVYYAVPDSAMNLPSSCSFCFGDVVADVESLQIGVGFLLWVHNGALDALEFYPLGEPFPEEIGGYRLRYIYAVRDLGSLPRVDFQGSSRRGDGSTA